MLDLQTLTFSSVAASSISALFFMITWKLNRNEKGVSSWLIALVLQPFAWSMLSMRDFLSDWLSIVTANTLIFSSFLFFYSGACQFWNKKKHTKFNVIIASIFFMMLFSFFTFLEPNIHIRIWLMYMATASIMSACILLGAKLPKIQRTIGVKIFILFCGFILALTILRVLTAEVIVPISTLFELNLSNFIGAMLGFTIPYGMALCAFLLCNERKVNQIFELEKKSNKEAQLKNNFLSILSHELRTPLNGMMGKAQLISDRAAEPSIKADCQTIVESGQALAELTNLVLEYASSESVNSTTLEESDIELHQLLTSIISLLEPLAIKKNIRLIKQIDIEPEVIIKLDHRKLRLVLINLLSNAIKYTDVGSVTLKLSCHLKEDKASLFFRVIDTGIGIPKNDQADLLSPFKRASNRGNKQDGVGLGLALASFLVKSLKSKIEFDSLEHKGSTFHFTLNVALGNKIKNPTTLIVAAQDPSLLILIIEDLEINQEITCNFLQQLGHQSVIASNGYTAQRYMLEHDFDLILLDMLLPDMHGTQLYLNIRTKNAGIPVIALTASVTESDLLTYQQLGINQVISKPLLKDNLKLAINASLKNKALQPCRPNNKRMNKYNFDPAPLTFLIENISSDGVEKILSSLPEQFYDYQNQLMAIIKEQNLEQWLYMWHKLSGFCAQLGLIELTNYCKKFESSQTVQAISFNQYQELTEQGIIIIKNFLEAESE